MTNPFCHATPIETFRSLGTGRKKKTVVATNGDYKILFVAQVQHNNRLTSRTVRFGNGKLFHTDSQTVDGQKVFLFWPTESLLEEAGRQIEMARIQEWLKSARWKDICALLDCVLMIRQKPQQNYHHEFMAVVARSEIWRHLEFLSLPELRRLTSVLGDPGCEKAA